MPTRSHFPRPTRGLLAVSVAVAVAMCLLVTAAPPRDRPAAVEANGADAEQGSASEVVPSFRPNDPLAIEAYFPKESYRPGMTARLRFASSLSAVRLQIFHLGPEWGKTVGNMSMRGVPVTRPVPLGPIQAGGSTRVTIGDWPTGLYFAQLTGKGGRIGYAPFVVPPRRLGQSRVAVVLPTRTGRRTTSATTTVMGLGTRGMPPRGHTGAALPAVPESWRASALPEVRPALPPLAYAVASVSTCSPRRSSTPADPVARSAVRMTCSSSPGTTSTSPSPSTTPSRAFATAVATSCSSPPTTSSGGSTSRPAS